MNHKKLWRQASHWITALSLGAALCGQALAAELHVLSSGGFTAAYKQLVPGYEKASGDQVVSGYGASLGGAPDSIPSRLARHEPADVVILSVPALEALVAAGQVRPGSRVDLGRSLIGLSVRKGTPKPDISSVEALKNTLLQARSIAYSASASGTYLSTVLFKQLGVADQIKDKARRIVSERVGSVVARGDAELGFQQVSELLPIEGLDFVGTLPDEVQEVTIFAAGITTEAREPEAAKALLRYLSSAEAAPVIRQTGLDPIPAKP